MEIAERISSKDLKCVGIFEELSDVSLEKIANICIEKQYEAGEYCAVQGEQTDHLLIVKRGKIAIEMEVHVPPHTHTVTIATQADGRVCSWSGLVPPNTLTSSVKCLEKTFMLSIAASELKRIFEKEPLIELIVMRNLARVISSRLRDSHIQLERLIAEVIKSGT